jgi:hypothetical protein
MHGVTTIISDNATCVSIFESMYVDAEKRLDSFFNSAERVLDLIREEMATWHAAGCITDLAA